MVYTTKSKKAPGPNNVVTPPAGGAKAEANVTSLDAEGRKGIGFYYDDEVRRTDTPAYIRILAPYVDAFNWAVSFLMYLLPPLCFAYQLYTGLWPTWRQVAFACAHSYWRFIMGWGIFHRLFSHQAYACNRLTAFCLGLYSTLLAQRGPLWWSSKHIRHHKFCENTGEYPYTDPHSIHRIQNWIYCYMGWTIHPYEMRVDWDFVRPQFKHWEMLLVETLTWIAPVCEITLRIKYFGLPVGLLHVYTLAFWLAVTLNLNLAGHADASVPEMLGNGRFRCKAIAVRGLLRGILELTGEADHADHHLYPAKAKRDNYFDVFYWTVLAPGKKLGIFWNVRDGVKGRIGETSKDM